MTATVSVTATINAPADLVWDLISDVTRMGEWSPETSSCRWLGEPAGPQVGARFAGTNEYRGNRWRTVCTVTAAERGREFAFDVTGARVLSVATWRYELRPNDAGCEVVESWADRRGAFLRWHGRRVQGITDRGEHNRRTMAETLDRLKLVAERIAAGT
jgi:uncharacterized protein YndB with AHSA1/START domain